MIPRKTRGFAITLEEARRRFERWRKIRPPTSRIPEALWTLAVQVAQEHGINQTCRALRLNHTTLKEHVRAAADHRRSQPPSATFVELAPLPAELPSCTIELENAQGCKMKIHLARPESLDLVALSQNLWSGKR